MAFDDHYPSLPLSPFQKQKIEELRNRAAEDLLAWPDYDTDFNLLRWLLGYDYDIEAILFKLRSTIITLTALSLDNKKAEDAASVNQLVRSLSPATEYFPGGIMGTDDQGNIIFMPELIPRLWSRRALSRWILFRSYVHAHSKNLQAAALAQEIFPDIARQFFVINSPLVIRAVYNMISPALSKQTKEKVLFLGSDWRNVLNKELGTHNIYSHWGGTKKHTAGPTGDLRMGGKVPHELQYNPKNDLDDVTVLKVSARSKQKVSIQAQKGQIVHWWWRVSSGDLDFWAERDRYIYWPMFRLSTEFHPEVGKFACKETDTFTFYFDNSHGVVWSNEVLYKIWTDQE